jgi:hypothetical protein
MDDAAREIENMKAALDARIAIHRTECGDFIRLDDAESINNALYEQALYPAPYCTLIVLSALRLSLEHFDEESSSTLFIDILTILERHEELTTSEYDELVRQYGKEWANKRKTGDATSAKFWIDEITSWADVDRKLVHSWLVLVERLGLAGVEKAELITKVRRDWDELLLGFA